MESRSLCTGMAIGSSLRITADRAIGREVTLGRTASVLVERELPYGASPVRRLDLYTPSGPAPEQGWPVVLAIHGGGWRKLDKSGYGNQAASILVRQGFAVVAPNYTLAAPGRASWPTVMDDLDAALDWIRDQGLTRSLDSRRVAVMGESAGAHLALLLAYRPSPARPLTIRAVVAVSPPTDLLSLEAESWRARSAVRGFLGGPPHGILRPTYLESSPASHVSADDPATLLIHGTSDSLVPANQSRVLGSKLAAAFVPYQLRLISGAGHELPLTSRSLPASVSSFLKQNLL
jgi:acetyl esterase/lipase